MFDFWKKLWRLIDLSQKKIKVLIAFLAVFEIVKLAGPYFLKLIIDTLLDTGLQNITLLLWYVFAMLVADEIQSIIGWFSNKLIMNIGLDIEKYLPIRAQCKLMELPLSYHEQENTGNKIIRIQRGVDHISHLLMNLFWEVLPTLLQLLTTTIILLFIDWRLGLTFLVFVPPFIWITFSVNKKLDPRRDELQKKWEESAGKMGQSIININTVKSFVQERREVREYGNIRNFIRKEEGAVWGRILDYVFVRDAIINTGRITVLILGIWLVSKGITTIGTLVFIITISEKAFFSMFRLSRFYDRIQDGKKAVERLIKLSDEEVEIKSPVRGLKPKDIKGEIEFKNASFAYGASHSNALENVNLKIEAGKITAFVGPSGGGKTTVARLIYRHYDPQEGAILLDGYDLRKYDLYHFRQAIAIVPQEVEIFNNSVSANISYANPKASFGEVKRAARIANADEFVKDLKDGYDTLAGERGIKLSGGQRQRIGIARAILANPKILIFDEATSSLDSHSEKLIQEAMNSISQSRTVIIIAHRLSTIRYADQIFVLEGGKLVEQGSHQELSDVRGGLYAKLLKLQSRGDVD